MSRGLGDDGLPEDGAAGEGRGAAGREDWKNGDPLGAADDGADGAGSAGGGRIVSPLSAVYVPSFYAERLVVKYREAEEATMADSSARSGMLSRGSSLLASPSRQSSSVRLLLRVAGGADGAV